ncbi:MAG TPA: tripartite tricarboxylate transporter substrate binding protein [Xanthobacteraceae bacterium]|nr:tripartite tricarboxylate transporter substrate binding protein [Xanthobacteraceae bacterium]
MRASLRISVALYAAALLAGYVRAENYPSRAIRIIVPISVGSVTDVAARLTAQELQARLGQTVIVVNKPGGAMVIGGSECAKSAPDGYTICLVSPDTMSFNPLTVPNLPYDPQKDFIPVIDMYHVIEGLIVPGGSPANSLEELQARAVAQAGKMTFGTLGGRTTTDAFRQWLGEYWHTSFVPVPYKGGSEIINATLADTIEVAKIGMGNMSGQIEQHKIKVLALNAAKRSPRFPDVATFREAGFSAFPGGPIYWGVVVPAGTDPAIIKRLHDELAAVLLGEKFKQFAEKNFLDVVAGSREEFVDFLKKDRQDAEVLVNEYMK